MKTQPERTEKTRQALKASFWQLYSRKPIEKITVREITEAAGVYRSTFYSYYSDVYAVLEEIEAGMLETYRIFICRIHEVHSFSDAINLITEFYTQNAEQLAILLGPYGDPHFLNELKTSIKTVVHEKLGMPDGDIDTEIFIEMGSSAVISMLNYWYEHRDTMSIEEVVNVSSRFLQHGLMPYIRKWILT